MSDTTPHRWRRVMRHAGVTVDAAMDDTTLYLRVTMPHWTRTATCKLAKIQHKEEE